METSQSQTYAAETPRLWLQPLSVEEHLDEYHALYSNPDALHWSTQGVHTSLAESRTALLSRLRSAERPWVEHYAILLRPEPQERDFNSASSSTSTKAPLIGLVGTIRQSEGPGFVPELGYRLNPDFAGKGYATEGVGAFVRVYWGLAERKDVMQISAVVDVRNTPSGRVMEKIGARRGERFFLDLDRLGRCEMERWILDRPKESS